MKKKIKCRITSRNNIIFIKPMVTRFTQIIRSLSLTEVGICISSGAIVEELDAEGNVIRNLNLNNYKESFATSDKNVSVSTTVKVDESPIVEETVSDEQPTEMESTLDQSDNESSTADEKEKEDEPEEDLDELQDDPYDNYNPPKDTE
jgi:hypothetical protein